MTHAAAEVGGWQIASTIGTFCAVMVAVIVYVTNIIHRRRDHERKSLAQARLVITGRGEPGLAEPTSKEGGFVAAFTVPFSNQGDRPVLDVYFEVWPPYDQWPLGVKSRGDVAPWAVMLPVVRAGEEEELKMNLLVRPNVIGGWRIRWTDADGQEWYRDRAPMSLPARMPSG